MRQLTSFLVFQSITLYRFKIPSFIIIKPVLDQSLAYQKTRLGLRPGQLHGLVVKKMSSLYNCNITWDNSYLRLYQDENTSSRKNTEVRQLRPWLALGWVTNQGLILDAVLQLHKYCTVLEADTSGAKKYKKYTWSSDLLSSLNSGGLNNRSLLFNSLISCNMLHKLAGTVQNSV